MKQLYKPVGYRGGVRNVDPLLLQTGSSLHQIFELSLMMAISIDFLFGRHHIPKDLKRTKLSSYRSWEVYALAGVINSRAGGSPGGCLSSWVS